MRLDGFGGSGLIDSGAVAVVDIAPSDVGFHSSGCGAWSNDLTPAVAPGQPFGPGAYFVGTEIAPGRYYARPDTDALSTQQCRWQRLREGADGFEESGRAWGAPAVVDIAESDTAFHSENCGTWTTDLTPSATPGQPFGDGWFLAGPEIAPGRYRAKDAGAPGCVWRRLRGFGGTDGDIIKQGAVHWDFWTKRFYEWRPEEKETQRPPVGAEGIVVDIAPADAGFYTTSYCGGWTPAPP